MKKFEFETSKGKFVLVEECKGISLKEITEEQATDIVDSFLFNSNDGSDYGDESVYKDYVTDEIYITNSIESLHSLIKSKGIHLFENPIELLMKQDCNCDLCQEQYSDDFKEFEQKTFYNPYIFKIK